MTELEIPNPPTRIRMIEYFTHCVAASVLPITQQVFLKDILDVCAQIRAGADPNGVAVPFTGKTMKTYLYYFFVRYLSHWPRFQNARWRYDRWREYCPPLKALRFVLWPPVILKSSGAVSECDIRPSASEPGK